MNSDSAARSPPPAAVAAARRLPDRTVVALAGDGDFLMNGQELATAIQHHCDMLVIVVDNGTYGTIRMHQERTFPGRVSATDLANPDFVQLAEAFGFHGERVSHTSDFASAFERAASAPGGALIELVIDVEALTPRQTLSQMRQAALARVDAAG